MVACSAGLILQGRMNLLSGKASKMKPDTRSNHLSSIDSLSAGERCTEAALVLRRHRDGASGTMERAGGTPKVEGWGLYLVRSSSG